MTRSSLKLIIFLVLWGMLYSPLFVYADSTDSDNDGLTDEQEIYYYTDPNNPDTDNDGYLDGTEVQYDYSPHKGQGFRMHENDYDEDGLNDWLERWFGSSIGDIDSDKDGYNDHDEIMYGYHPMDPKGVIRLDRRIEVDRSKQWLYYYVDKVKIYSFPVSTGNYYSETPEGYFDVQRKVDNKRYIGADYDLPNVLWNMQFKTGYYIHGAYWHNDFGRRTHSHGCVNMRNADAEVLYKYIGIGVPVNIYGETPKKYKVGT